MSFEGIPSGAPMRAALIGNESLLIECAKIWRSSGHEVAMIVTRNADIADWAKAQKIDVLHHSGALKDFNIDTGYDWLLSIANLQMIPQYMLDQASHGAVNFHDGPLPAYAGLNAPVWARLEGANRHGITWHMIEGAVDEGDILVQRNFDISENDTALTLNTKCFEAALNSFADVVAALAMAELPRQPQDLSKRSYYGRFKRPEAFGLIDLNTTSKAVVQMVRALDHGDYLNPLVTPKISVDGMVLAVQSAKATRDQGAAGTVLAKSQDSLTVATNDGAVQLGGLRHLSGAKAALSQVQLNTICNLGADRTALCAAQDATVKAEDHWRSKLADFAPLHLPLVKAAAQSPQFQTLPVSLPETLTAEARLAALALLAQSSGAENSVDLALAADHAPEAAAYQSSWVPLSFEMQADTPITQLLDLAEIQLAKAKGKPAFALDLALRDPAITDISTPDVAVSFGGQVSDAAMTFDIASNRLTFDETRLPTDHAERLIARLELIANQLAKPSGTLSDLEILPETERKSLLTEWNQTAVDVDLETSIHEAIAAQAAKTPDATALVFEHQSLSYAELNIRANQVAHVLQADGVQKGDVVGIHCKRSLDLVIACLGAMKAGAAYLPLDPGFPADRLAIYVEDSAAKFIISQSAIQADLPESKASILTIDADPRIAQADKSDVDAGAKGADLAYLIFTSGSTGRPKGVMVEHRNVANFFAGMDSAVPQNGAGTWLAVTSLSFDISVLELFYTLSRGFKLVLSGDESATQISDGPVGSGASGIDFSLYYWGNDDGAGKGKYELLLKGAQFADDNGFCAVWTPERHFHAFGGPYPNPSVTGAAVAGFVKNIGVRAGSCVAPLHHTARIAEEWAVIDNLTDGKAGLAIASGWQPDDFVLRPENTPPANKTAMFEQIKDLRTLWKGEPVEFPRQDGTMMPVVTQPRPVSDAPEIWVTTAGNPETWKEAGRNGANVLTHLLGQTIDEVQEKTAIYHAALREAGYDPAKFKVTLMLHTFVGNTREEARETARDPMKNYLRSAAGLIKQYAWAFPAFKKPDGVKNPFELDLTGLTDEEMDGILDFAFQRYFEDSGLFGTVNDCVQRVEELKKIGVAEVACLIDYGIPTPVVLDGLTRLAQVLKETNQEIGVADSDVSIAGQVLRHKVTHLQCTPSMARMLTMNTEASIALAQVDHLMIGGEALPGKLVGELNAITDATITNMYGPTETTIWSSTAKATADDGIVHVGQPIANTGLYVLDDAMQPVPLGVAGELYIGGAGVTRGYWQRDDLTQDRFVKSPFDTTDRLYRTGDLVRGRLDGGLDFIGRADHQVKIRGYRIELGEIESRLEEMQGINQAVVIPREDNPGDVRLVAYLRGDQSDAMMRAHLSEHLPDYMVPRHFVRLDSFPLTPNKKVDRKALPKPSAPKPAPQAIAPVASAQTSAKGQAAIQQSLAAVWERILGIANVGPNDNFFDLGGHSLLAVQAHRELRDSLGFQTLSITDIFRFPTLGALAERIETLGGSAPARTTEQPVPPAAGQQPQPIASAGHPRQDAMLKRRALRARRREIQS